MMESKSAPKEKGAEQSESNSAVSEVLKEPVTPPGSPVSRSGSPNGQSCPVCLGPINNVSFTDTCAHEFCFNCLVQWSRVKPECPLCKRRFNVIMYDVKSAAEYSKLPVNQIEPERPDPLDALSVLRSFRYPTTLATQSDFFRLRQNREVAAIRRRYQQLANETQRRYLENMRLRLYRNRLKTVVTSNSRVREASPDFFRRYPASIHRLMPFLNRELRVLLVQDTQESSRLINIITNLLPRVRITSDEFVNAVRPFLGSRSRRFCQELMTFAKCPYDLAGYDRNAIYEADSPPIDVDAAPEPPFLVNLLSSPEFNPNNGIANSYSEFIRPSTSNNVNRLAPSLTTEGYTIEISSDSSSGESIDDLDSWIDVASIQPHTGPPTNSGPHTVQSSDSESSCGSECQIVGFDRPWEERSPVNVSSAEDTEDVVTTISSTNGDESVPGSSQQIVDKPIDIDSRKRRHSEDEKISAETSPSHIAARGKRWSPQALLAAASEPFRSSFLPSLLTSQPNAIPCKSTDGNTNSSPSSCSGEDE